MNPGIEGRGIPNLITVLRSGQQLARLVKGGHLGGARSLLRVTAANVWHHRLSPGRHERRVQCPCCGWSGPQFLFYGPTTVPSVCPSCDSRSRHRGLWTLYAEVVEAARVKRVLHFAPERILLRRLQELGCDVETTDRKEQGVDHPCQDIQALSIEPGQFHMVVCNHVLEHVEQDEAAMSECARMLVPGGVAVFTIPGDFRRRPTEVFARPTSNGHLRHYGLDVVDKLERVFARVEVVDLGQRNDARFGVRDFDLAFVCRTAC